MAEQRPDEQARPKKVKIIRPVPGLIPRWVGAILYVDEKVACNDVPEREIDAILAHPECFIVLDDDASAVEPQPSGALRPHRVPGASFRPLPGHLKPL